MENNAFRKIVSFLERPLVGIAVGIVVGAIGSLLSIKWLFVAAWTALVISIIRERWKVYSKGVSVAAAALILVGLWYLTPKLKEMPTADDIARSVVAHLPVPKTDAVTATVTPAPKVNRQANEPFAVNIAYAILSFGDKSHNSGYWLASRANNQCSLSPAQAVLFIRITNLRSISTMVTAYDLESKDGPLTRLKTEIGQMFILLPRGVLKGGDIEKTMQFSQGPGQFSMVSFDAKDADPAHAIPVQLATLDQQIGDKYIEPDKSVRGWAFFQYPVADWAMPPNVQIRITDQLGKTTSYSAPLKNGDPNGDVMPRQMTLKNPVDVSNCSLDAI